MILAGTNNYLGLTFNHDAISEGQAALAAQGTGTTGSRMANGGSMRRTYGVVEKEYQFFQSPYRYRFFNRLLPLIWHLHDALADHNAVVLLELPDSHASIYDACSLGGAEIVGFTAITMLKIWNGAMVRLVNGRKTIIIIDMYGVLVAFAHWRKLLISNIWRLSGCLIVDEAH